jgi:hypothetical protein
LSHFAAFQAFLGKQYRGEHNFQDLHIAAGKVTTARAAPRLNLLRKATCPLNARGLLCVWQINTAIISILVNAKYREDPIPLFRYFFRGRFTDTDR